MVTDGGEIARFHATITADIAGLQRSVAAARAELAGLSRGATQSAGQASNAFRAIAAGVGLGLGFAGLTALTRGLSDAARATMSYETAFVGVRRTVEATDAQYASLDQTIRRMATSSLPLGRDALANIATIGGQMNVPIDKMESFIDTVARFSVASNGIVSPESAAAGLGKLLPQLRIPLEDSAKLASAIAKGADVGLGNEQEIMDIALRTAAAQRLAGFTPAQTLALAATGPKLGNPEEVGTALATVPTQISKIVQSGGDDLQALALISGVTAEQFKQQWATDAFGAFQMFTQGIGRLGEGVFPALEEMGLGGARVGKVLLGIASDQAEVELQLANATEQLATGAAVAEESEKAFGTAASQIAIFKSQMIEIGDQIAGPFVEAMVGAMPTLMLFADTLSGVLSGKGGGLVPSGGFASGIQKQIMDVTGINGVKLIGGVIGDAVGMLGEASTGLSPLQLELQRMAQNRGGRPDLDPVLEFAASTAKSSIATTGGEVKGPVDAASQGIIDRINAIYAGKGGGAAPRLSEEQKAINQVEEAHTRELVEAYVKGGDKRVAVVRAEQARLDAAWTGVARDLHDKLGVAVPEEFRLMWEAAQKETKEKGKDTLSGLLGFLAARDTEHGANPLSKKFAFGDGPSITIEGDVNFGLRPDIPGGIDADAGFTVLATKDFKSVGR